MIDELDRRLLRYHQLLEPALDASLPRATMGGGERLTRAVHTAVFPGGKRWRPALTLLGGQASGAAPQDVLPAACAIEYVHSASLVLDDLPCMDDARMRRGRETLHLLFGEELALLSALALINRSYELFLRPVSAERCGAGARVAAAAAQAIGVAGMVGGQAVDLDAGSGSPANSHHKTTSLVRLAVTAGAMAANAPDEDVEALGRYGDCVGAAFQIQDDVLDACGDAYAAGKSLRQDVRHARQAWPSRGTLVEAGTTVEQLLDEARQVIVDRFGDRAEARLLVTFAERIVHAQASAASIDVDRIA